MVGKLPKTGICAILFVPYAASLSANASLLEKGGEFTLTKVYLRDGESPENLLKRFRKKVTRDGILSTVKKKRFFVSKSEQRRLAQRKAVRRERRRQWRERRRSSSGR